MLSPLIFELWDQFCDIWRELFAFIMLLTSIYNIVERKSLKYFIKLVSAV